MFGLHTGSFIFAAFIFARCVQDIVIVSCVRAPVGALPASLAGSKRERSNTLTGGGDEVEVEAASGAETATRHGGIGFLKDWQVAARNMALEMLSWLDLVDVNCMKVISCLDPCLIEF